MDVEGGDPTFHPDTSADLVCHLTNWDALKKALIHSVALAAKPVLELLDSQKFGQSLEKEKKKFNKLISEWTNKESTETAFLIAPFISCTIMKNNHKKDWKPKIIYNIFFSEVRSLFWVIVFSAFVCFVF